MLFRVSGSKTVRDQISLHLPRLSPHCHCLVASKEDSKTGTFDEKENLVSSAVLKIPTPIPGSKRNQREP